MIYARSVMEVTWNWPCDLELRLNWNVSGFGASVLSQLLKTKIKRNLYYEIKDRVFEERYRGATVEKKTKKVKVYGFDETKQSRELLMQILRDRMDNHKAKFISPIIYNELCTLEVKKNGKIEHSATAHDDQIFSYLMALYVWYEGKDLMERYGLEKSTLYTDEDMTVEDGLSESYIDITDDMGMIDNPIIEENKKFFKDKSGSVSYEDWQQTQFNEDQKAIDELMKNPISRAAWLQNNHEEDDGYGQGMVDLPNSVFMVNLNDNTDNRSDLQKEFDNIINLR